LRDQTPLGLLDRPQVAAIVSVLHVRNGSVQTAGDARRRRVLRRHQPVASGRRLEPDATAIIARVLPCCPTAAMYLGLGRAPAFGFRRAGDRSQAVRHRRNSCCGGRRSSVRNRNYRHGRGGGGWATTMTPRVVASCFRWVGTRGLQPDDAGYPHVRKRSIARSGMGP
jgi:hypothetical protein